MFSSLHVAAALLLAACTVGPSPTTLGPTGIPGPTATELASGTVTEDGITLSATARPAVVPAGQPIEVEAMLSHDRPEPLLITGSGSGIVSFSVTRLEDGLGSGPPVMTGDCARHEIPAGEPLVVAFVKSGGYSPDDPNAEFMEIYNASPELTLPAGTWRIDVTVHGNLGAACDGPQLGHALALTVTVTD